MVDLTSPAPNEKRTRTFKGRSNLGCVQCRKRHVKCDQQKPSCQRCVAQNRQCSLDRTVQTTKMPPVAIPSASSASLSSGTTNLSQRSPSLLLRSLGNSIYDPNETFESIGAPSLYNLDSLVHWLSLKTPITPRGWFGSMTSDWTKALVQYSYQDPGLLAVAAYFALTVQEQLTGIAMSRYSSRAELIALREVQKYKTTTGSLLMIISGIACMDAVGDPSVHMGAIKALFEKQNIQVDEFEWVSVWGTDAVMAAMGQRAPFLPYYVPGKFRYPTMFSADIVSISHRLGTMNASSMIRLIQEDFVQVSEMFQQLHRLRKALYSNPLLLHDLSIHGYILLLCRKTTVLMHKYRIQAQSVATSKEDARLVSKCRRLLGIALQASAWWTVARQLPGDIICRGQLKDLWVEVIFLDGITELFNEFDDLQQLIQTWTLYAEMEALLWIASLVIAKSGSKFNATRSQGIDLLVLGMLHRGIRTQVELQRLLMEWPMEDVDLEFVLQELCDGLAKRILQES